MSDGERFLNHLEELSRSFPSRDADEAAVRFTAGCYAAAYAVATKRVRSEPFLAEADRRTVFVRLLGRYRELADLAGAGDGESPSYEALQLAASVLESARCALMLDEPEWIEGYPEFQRTLSREAHALEARIGTPDLEALHRDAAALAEA
jgi:hypothetical protein